MARDESLPWEIGGSFNNQFTGVLDTTVYGGTNYEGQEFVVLDPAGTGRKVRVRAVKNASAINLLPARLAVFKAIAGKTETQVDGYTFAVGDRPAGVVDPNLPAGGVLPNDWFYLFVEGPCNVITTDAGVVALTAGVTRLVPGAGTNKTSADAGKVFQQDLTGAAAVLGNNVQNQIGITDTTSAANTATIAAVLHLGGTRAG
jgi:hypothetical protein